MIYRYICVMLLMLHLYGAAQNTTMRFTEEEWNFGRIREVDGEVEHTFTFTNSGRIAFVIEKVTVSCGCTTPVFTKDPILPGEQGRITIKYDPTDRPGVFLHEIGIVSKKGRNKNTIRIRGEVIPRPRRVEDDYPYTYPDGMRFSLQSLNFGTIEQGKSKSLKIGYINRSKKPVALAFEIPTERKFLTVSTPRTVAPGEKGEITVTYDLSKHIFYGRYTDRIVPIIDGKRQDIHFFAIFTAIDDRDGVDPDDSPEIAISPMFHHFGDVGRKEKLSRKIKIANEGKRPLTIRWVDSKPFVRVGLKEGATIQPGTDIEFTVTIDAGQLESGMNSVSVTVISNDPLKPVRAIRFAANVK